MDELEEIHQQIEDLKKKAIELAKINRIPIIEDMKRKISLYGISANELGFSEKSSSTTKPAASSVEVKYKQGDKTWTGRGRKPNFVLDYLEGGGVIEDLRVK